MTVIRRSKRTLRMYCVETANLAVLGDSWTMFDDTVVSETPTKYNNAISDYLGWESSSIQQLASTSLADFQRKLSALQRYSFVLNDWAKPLEEFKNVKELLQVFHDAIQAHHNALVLANVLYGDISPVTIMISNKGDGVLVDWDLSKPNGNRQFKSLERMGTWQFLAYRLVGDHLSDVPLPVHNEDDDLESFWYVLFWVALRRSERTASDDTIFHELEAVFDGAYSNNGVVAAHQRKFHALQNDQLIGKYSFGSAHLATILEEYQAVIRQRYNLSPDQIDTIGKHWKKVKAKYLESSEEELKDKIEVILFEMRRQNFPHSGASPARLLSETQWAKNLFSKVLTNTPPAAWNLRGTNKLRPLLDPCKWTSGKREGPLADPEDGEGRPAGKCTRFESDLIRIP